MGPMDAPTESPAASKEQQVVMYLVARSSLNMSAGKIGAQIGHAVQMLMCDYLPDKHRSLTTEEYERHQLVREWLYGEYGKIVLVASDDEFMQLHLEYDDNCYFIVVDNGHTEVAPKSETLIGFWPMRRCNRSKTLKRLKRLGDPRLSTPAPG